MIFGLELENFMSFRDRQFIDLRVAPNVRDDTFPLEPIWEGSPYRAPLVVAFFGANGAGKSNVLRAFSFIVSFARDSFAWSTDFQLPFQPFADEFGRAAPTKLALHFAGPRDLQTMNSEPTSGGFRAECAYTYELELSSMVVPRVEREALYYYPARSKRRIFERLESDVKVSASFGHSSIHRILKDVLRPNASVISTLAQLNDMASINLRYVAQTVVSNISETRFEPTDDHAVNWYDQNRKSLEKLNREISRLDVGIESAAIISDPGKPPRLEFTHAGLSTPIKMNLESHGTRQFLRIFPHIAFALEYGGVAIIDELDSNIHALLLPEITSWFCDPLRNPRKAQLWATCQAASLLEDFTKEQIFFCEKGRDGRSTVFGLKDIANVRRVDNFYKKYLGGTYGAVPRVG